MIAATQLAAGRGVAQGGLAPKSGFAFKGYVIDCTVKKQTGVDETNQGIVQMFAPCKMA